MLFEYADPGGCTSAAVCFLGLQVRIKLRHRYSYFVSIVYCAVSGLCNELVTRSEEFYRVCLCLIMFDLGITTNSPPSHQIGCSTTVRQLHEIYLQTLQLQSASSSRSSTVRFFSCVDAFVGHVSE